MDLYLQTKYVNPISNNTFNVKRLNPIEEIKKRAQDVLFKSATDDLSAEDMNVINDLTQNVQRNNLPRISKTTTSKGNTNNRD